MTGSSSSEETYYLVLNTGAHQLFCSQLKVNQSTRVCNHKRGLTTHTLAWSVSKVLNFVIPKLSRGSIIRIIVALTHLSQGWNLKSVFVRLKSKMSLATPVKLSLCEYHKRWLVSIGIGNGLVPSGRKLLPKPMLTECSVAIWRHEATVNWL